MSAQHTPGHWQVFDHYCGRDPETAGDEYARTRLIGLGQYDTIAEVRMGHEELQGDVDANARLIAAAPELLQAAIACAALLKCDPNHEGSECVEMAFAAIAKATGEA